MADKAPWEELARTDPQIQEWYASLRARDKSLPKDVVEFMTRKKTKVDVKRIVQDNKPKLNPMYQETLDYLRPLFNVAIKKAENNPNNFGVLSEQVDSPAKANRVLNRSIDNNFARWTNLADYNYPKAIEQGIRPHMTEHGDMRWISDNPALWNIPDAHLVDTMQQRWAPIGAANDPNNLNVNWAPNVRKFIKQQVGPEQYEKMRQMHLVQTPWGGDNYAV